MLSLIESRPWTALKLDENNKTVPTDDPFPVRLTPDFGHATDGGPCVVSYAAVRLYHSDGRWRNRHADPDLLLLAARCLAKDAWDRPGVRALAEAVETGTARGSHYYRRMPYAENEHMAFIDTVVRDVMVRPPPAAPQPLPPAAATAARPRPPPPPPPPPAGGLREALRRAATEAKPHRRPRERRRRESSSHHQHHRRHRR